jgi:hypothetical protein
MTTILRTVYSPDERERRQRLRLRKLEQDFCDIIDKRYPDAVNDKYYELMRAARLRRIKQGKRY